MTHYHCSMCNHCFHPSYQAFYVHPDNYNEYMSTYEYQCDAGYQCPLNCTQDDYISLMEEDKIKREKEAEEQARMTRNGIFRAHDLVDEDNNELSLKVSPVY